LIIKLIGDNNEFLRTTPSQCTLLQTAFSAILPTGLEHKFNHFLKNCSMAMLRSFKTLGFPSERLLVQTRVQSV